MEELYNNGNKRIRHFINKCLKKEVEKRVTGTGFFG
jgi:hypothetical protein